MADTSGELLGGRYRLLGERTSFPFGAWWEAEDDQGARTIVLRMSVEVADPAAKVQHAISACARIDTPHLVPWGDGGVDAKGQGWLAAPMFGPWSLTEHVTRGEGIPPVEAAPLIHQVARAIASGEAHGIVHNCLASELIRLVPLPEGGYGVKLYGYGLSDLLPSYKPLRKQDAYLGVPDYMSPELCAGKAAEGSSADIYAIGILMYEAVRGRPPFAPTFASASASTTLKRHIFEKPLPLHVRYANAPFIKSYENICFKALAKTANRRHLTVAEFEKELEQLLADEMRSQIVPLSSISGRNPATSRRLRTQVLPSVPMEAPSVQVAPELSSEAEALEEKAAAAAPIAAPAGAPADKADKVVADKAPPERAPPSAQPSADEEPHSSSRREGTLVFAGLGPAVRELAEAARKAEEDNTDDEGTGEEEAESASAGMGSSGPATRKGKKKKNRKGSSGAPAVANSAPTTQSARPGGPPNAAVAQATSPTSATIMSLPRVEAATGETEGEESEGAPAKEARVRRREDQTVRNVPGKVAAVKAESKDEKPRKDEQEEWFSSGEVPGEKKQASRAWLFLLLAAAVIVVIVVLLTLGSKEETSTIEPMGFDETGARYNINSPEPVNPAGAMPTTPTPDTTEATTRPDTGPAADTVAVAADTAVAPSGEPTNVVAPEPIKAVAPDVVAPEPPKVVTPKVEPPMVVTPKVEPPKVVTPKVEPPKVVTPKVEPPKVVTPKVEPPKVVTPKVEPPVTPPAGSPEEQFKAQAKHYLQLGISAYKADNFQLAAGYFKKAQEADPSNAVAASYLKKAQEKLGQ